MKELQQHGGLKVKEAVSSITTSSFDLIRRMLSSPGAKIELFSFDSLIGFIFRLSVDLPHAQYLDIQKSKFQTPVTEYIMKLSVITDNSEAKIGTFLKEHKKYSMTPQEFIDEAIFQQNVWLRGIQGGREPISPSVANVSLFTNKQAILLLHELQYYDYSSTNDLKNEFFTFMFELFYKKKVSLGILTMALKPRARSMSSELKRTNHLIQLQRLPNGALSEIYAMALSNILRLVLQMKIIHIDLHKHNILFYDSPETVSAQKCILIDFGRASFLSDGKTDQYFQTIQQKKQCLLTIEKMFDTSLNHNLVYASNEMKQIQFIETVLNYIVKMHVILNSTSFDIDKNNHQLSWISKIPDKESCFLLTYQMYLQKVQTLDTRFSETTLKKYVQEGRIENLDTSRDLRSFYYVYKNINNNKHNERTKSKATKKTSKTKSKARTPIPGIYSSSQKKGNSSIHQKTIKKKKKKN